MEPIVSDLLKEYINGILRHLPHFPRGSDIWKVPWRLASRGLDGELTYFKHLLFHCPFRQKAPSMAYGL